MTRAANRLVVTALLLLSASPAVRLSALTAQDSFPSRPPKPTPLPPVRFPPFKETTLPNGLQLAITLSDPLPAS